MVNPINGLGSRVENKSSSGSGGGGGGGGVSCPTLDGEALSSFNLTAAWSFDDAGSPLEDSQDSTYDLAIGGSAPTYEVAGKRGTAIQFASDTHFVQAESGFQPAGDFTLSMWVKFSSVSTENRIFTWSSDITSNAEQIAVHMNTSGAIVLSGDSDASLGSGGTLVADHWYLVTFLRTGTTWKVYLGRVEIITSSTQGSDDLSSWSLYIGRKVSVYAPSMTAGGATYYKAALSVNAQNEIWAHGRGNFVGDAASLTPPSGTNLDTFADDCIHYWDMGQTGAPLTNAFTGGVELNIYQGSGESYQETGPIEYAFKFGATGDNALVADEPPFRDIGTGDFTISMWLYPASGCNIVSVTNDANNNNFATSMWLSWVGDTWQLWGLTAAAQKIISSASYSVNTWHLVTITRESGVVYLNVNKDAEGSTLGLSGFDMQYADLYFGEIKGFDSPNSRIANTVIYSEALTIAAITELYDDLPVAT